MFPWQALDEAVQTQTPQLISHLPLGDGAGIETQKLSESLFKFFLLEPGREDAQNQQRLKQGLHGVIAKAQSQRPVYRNRDGTLECWKVAAANVTVVAELLDVEQTSGWPRSRPPAVAVGS